MHTRSAESVGLYVYGCCGPLVEVPVPHVRPECIRKRTVSPHRRVSGMTVDLMGIPLHFIDNVYLVGAAYKHLEIVQRWGLAKANWRHTIMALTRVSPTTTNEPGC
jgi:hypothetical protein